MKVRDLRRLLKRLTPVRPMSSVRDRGSGPRRGHSPRDPARYPQRPGPMPRGRVAGAMKPLTVRYELDESGAWIASIPSVKGCHTYGRSLSQARQRIREALWAATDDKTMAYSVELSDDVRLPAALRRLLTALERARQKEQAASIEARKAALDAVRGLSRRHLSRRDAAMLTGYSFQRVQQIASDER
jgi:predicted RNase H-like HicB family nuclease